MTMTRLIVLLVSLLIPRMSLAGAAELDTCDAACQRTQIENYYAGIDAIMLAGSSVADIDDLLGRLHEDVRYIHEEYEADFDKSTWRKAFVRQLEKGAYNDGPDGLTSILRVIHGYEFAAVEVISRYTENGVLIETKPRLVTFKFDQGKILQIKEHWYHLAEQ